MAKDSNDRSEGPATIENPSSPLSAQAFSNPADFLQVLKKDYNQIAQPGSGKITQSDLIAYSEHGSDPQGRMAAKIAAAHYGELQAIANRAIEKKAAPKDGISANDLQMDINLMNGDEKGALKTIRERDLLGMTAGVLATGGGVIGALGTCEFPPLGYVLGAAGFAAAGVTASLARDLYQAPDKLKAETTKDQQMVNSWLNVDGGQKVPPSVQQKQGEKVSNV